VDGSRKIEKAYLVQNCTVVCRVRFWGIFETLSVEIFYTLREA
jgi:hypothetical protein